MEFSSKPMFLCSILLLSQFFVALGTGELSLHYYSKSCPKAESLVGEEVKKLYYKHGNTAISWLRNLFHDCMVEGCDASLLLKTVDGKYVSEQTSEMSFGMRNFKYVNTIKEALEKECPSTVSCADIIALSASYGSVMLHGPFIPMKTGRRDGTKSYVELVKHFIPNHNDSISLALTRFEDVGLGPEGVVALLGAHSVGRVHCTNLVDRLYPKVDPTLDPDHAKFLKGRCPTPHPDPSAVLYSRNDRETPMILDNYYYKNILSHKVLLEVDQQLLYDSRTSPFVKNMAANNSYFEEQFVKAMLVLSEYKPLTGLQGEIRKDCRFVNGN